MADTSSLESLLHLMAKYNEVFYPGEVLGVSAVFLILPDGSGHLYHFLTEKLLLEFKTPQELRQFLQNEVDNEGSRSN